MAKCSCGSDSDYFRFDYLKNNLIGHFTSKHDERCPSVIMFASNPRYTEHLLFDPKRFDCCIKKD